MLDFILFLIRDHYFFVLSGIVSASLLHLRKMVTFEFPGKIIQN